MDVPTADPGRAVRAGRAHLDRALASVLDGGRFVHGSEHDAFERELAEFVGVEHCVAVGSGTDALELALRGVGCVPGDEVITAANAGFYASAAALAAGLDVRYADVDPTTLSVTADTIEPVVSEATRAVVVTHLYGLLAELDAIVALCRDRGLWLVEDCAQAIGAERDGRRAGSFGDAAAFSFYPTKNLAGLGDGGAVVAVDATVAARVRALRQYGWSEKYTVAIAGGRNSRLDELQAAVLRMRLPLVEAVNDRRRIVASRYAEAVGSRARFVLAPGRDYVAHLAVMLVHDRDRVRGVLADAGVATEVHYPVADHRQPVWAGRYEGVHLPATEEAIGRIVSIPCFETLTDDEVGHVCAVLRGI